MRVLVACEFSGTVRDAFTKKGHYAMSCDLEASQTEGNHYQGDVLDIIGEGWDMMIAHPPCTYLTVTGNKWMKPEFAERFPTRQQDREDAVNFFMKLANAPIEKICIENPIGIMSTRFQKPNQIIQPWQYGHNASKSTCLWLKGLPNLIPTDIVENLDYFNHKSGKRMNMWYYETSLLPLKDRAKVRNVTFQGIADAMADQWGKP